jgi:hypothetical protein
LAGFDACSWHHQVQNVAGINAVGEVPTEQRIEAQEFLLRRFINDLAKAPRPLICYRTPLDMIGYCLGEVTMHNTPELGERIHAYVAGCLNATLVHFDIIIVIRPLPVYTADATKPPPSPAYQNLVQLLIERAANQVNEAIYVEWLDVRDLEERRQYSKEILVSHIAEQSKQVRRH